MPRSRQWLADQGLAKLGKGRLSFAAKKALADAIAQGKHFDDIRQDATGANVVVARPKIQAEEVGRTEPVRAESVFYVIERATKLGQADLVIAFEFCSACNKHIKYCKHDMPKPPAWITAADIYFEKPGVNNTP
jgi:hypothetical protein